MFRRDHHVRIATILQAFDTETLLKYNCFFGGGTAIVLSHGEYRESVDIDFLVSDLNGYRDLRQALANMTSLKPLLRKGGEIKLVREIRKDQYGIRTMCDVGGVPIKIEIVFEGRISLDKPTSKDYICGVPTLTEEDMATTKLLANSDRWADDAVNSRDLIDLAMLDLPSAKREKTIEKAATAYGESVKKDLHKAIENLKARPGRLNECLNSLRMDTIPEALIWERIRRWHK